jgi:hypothetical protein
MITGITKDSEMDLAYAAKAPSNSAKDPQHAVKAPKDSAKDSYMTNTIAAIDFGTGDALAIHGPEGQIAKKSLSLPRVAGGKTPSHEFPMILEALLHRGYDVVVESPTIGSSGAERGDVLAILREHPGQKLYTLSARAIKNYRMDFDLVNPKSYAKYETISEENQVDTHKLDAEILYIIATTMPYRLRVWHQSVPAPRIHASVRPMDKRGYRDERSEAFMALLPPVGLLPDDMRRVLAPSGKYSRSLVMPFAMALTEPYWREQEETDQRKAFLKILGAYDHGYPSFYRRMTITWMQALAKQMAGVTRMQEVPRDIRTQAQRIVQRHLRHLFHMSKSVSEELVAAALSA